MASFFSVELFFCGSIVDWSIPFTLYCFALRVWNWMGMGMIKWESHGSGNKT